MKHLWTLILIVLLSSCIHKEDNIAPKPQGYFRLTVPDHEYRLLDTSLLPFSMDCSQFSYCNITKKDSGKVWIDINYPQQNAVFKMSYFPVHGNLRELMLSEQKMMQFHYQKADNVEYSFVKDDENHVYGQIYDIEGKEVATPLQFWLTDSNNHFVRATLYFNFCPNNDSLEPVIHFLREDALHLVNTLNWKNR